MKITLNHFKKRMQTKNGNVTCSRNNADVDTDFVIIYVSFIDVILVKCLGIISVVVYLKKMCTFNGVSNVVSSTFECMTCRSPVDKSDHFLVMVDTSPCRPEAG